MEGPALPVRSDLEDLEAYLSPQRPARYRMNTNESPYPPPSTLLEAVTEKLEQTELNRYPDRDANALLDALSERTGWPREGIWVANGSNEVLLHLFLTFGGPERTSLTFEPTYSLHTLIARIAGNRVRSSQREAPGFGIDAGVQRRDMAGADIVMFCSPNNPTGRLEQRDSIELALETAPLVVVDEAYVEFAPHGGSVADLLGEHRNLAVVRTFSKAWSLAGVRLGYMLAASEVVTAMAKVRLPYSISTFSQFVGVAAVQHAAEEQQRIAAIVRERQRISDGLGSLGLTVHPSDANFVLFDVGGPGEPDPRRTEEIWRGLLDRGVLVRNYASNHRIAGCLRVTAGLPEETDAFLAALGEVL